MSKPSEPETWGIDLDEVVPTGRLKKDEVRCPECGLNRKKAYVLTGAPCAACDTVYAAPAPAAAPEPEPAPKKVSRREVQAAVAMMFLD